MGEKAPVHDPELRWFGRFGLRLGEGLRLDVVHVNAALAAGRTRAGPGTLLEIRSCEIWPDVVSLNSVMNVGAQNGQWQDVLDLLSAPKQLHLQPDLITYGSTFCAFDRGGQWHRALQMLRSMPSRVVEPNLISYNSVLAAVGTWPRAMELLVKAQVSLLLPDVISFGASQTDAWQHAAGILGRMLQISVKPNAVVFNRALSASCRSGRPWRQAIRLLEQAEERRLADLITYSSAIAACATGRSWQYALALLNAIRLAKLKPNEIAFNSVLSAISEWTRALAILSSMDRKTVASFGAAIGTCEKAGQWQMALQLLVMMGEAEIEANVITFNSAISACTQGSEWPMALALLSTMASEHLWPDTVSMNSAISACAESGRLWVAVSLIESMSEFTTSPNTITLNSAMNVCEKGGFWAVALKLLGDFGRRRLDSTTISLHTAGSSCVKALHWQHAQHIFDTEDDVTITTLAATAWELSEKAQPLCSVLSELQWQMAGDLRGFSALEKK